MKFLRKIMVLCAFIASMGMTASLMAAESNLPTIGGDAPQTAQQALKKDAICTRCHDESEPTPILSIYQTKHGVKGDPRTPTCQSCHGESEKHLKGDPNVKGRAAPDVIFKKGTYAASDNKVLAAQCLTCHKGEARTNWEGSQHQKNEMSCNNCHVIHAPADKVRDRKVRSRKSGVESRKSKVERSRKSEVERLFRCFLVEGRKSRFPVRFWDGDRRHK